MNAAYTIYYAEDDLDDLYILSEVMEAYPEVSLRHFANGQLLLETLARTVPGAWPCLILLDLNMPQLDGRETLMQLRANDAWNSIPVVLFTTSNSVLDLRFAAQWQVELITKPLLFDGMEQVARRIVGHCRSRLAR
ncbi:response regulator [Flaviaesturariibacter flavus]|uniref:Response regulator n=1 Tax=Flaviaesturariibacter flavus TaxID=2502780 RepID=A0A4R1B9I3_9BACT|nr:response regulator [Flaviaesturariibacter flavus]TCJ13564.1 response regulator [Flaviaesturariibacter flavus]